MQYEFTRVRWFNHVEKRSREKGSHMRSRWSDGSREKGSHMRSRWSDETEFQHPNYTRTERQRFSCRSRDKRFYFSRKFWMSLIRLSTSEVLFHKRKPALLHIKPEESSYCSGREATPKMYRTHGNVSHARARGRRSERSIGRSGQTPEPPKL